LHSFNIVERKNGGGGQRAMMLKSWQAKEV
jgi:hypothetical protein